MDLTFITYCLLRSQLSEKKKKKKKKKTQIVTWHDEYSNYPVETRIVLKQRHINVDAMKDHVASTLKGRFFNVLYPLINLLCNTPKNWTQKNHEDLSRNVRKHVRPAKIQIRLRIRCAHFG